MAKRGPAKRSTGRAAAARKPGGGKRSTPRRSARAAKRASGKGSAPASSARKTKRVPSRAPAHPVMAPMKGADTQVIAGVQVDVARAGAARVKRVIYPPDFHWAQHMKQVTGTDLCMHAHVGFLVQGEIHIEYGDGCIVEHKAPQIVAIEPGHDGWVVGTTPVVLIEIDFERDTINRLGMPSAHRHE